MARYAQFDEADEAFEAFEDGGVCGTNKPCGKKPCGDKPCRKPCNDCPKRDSDCCPEICSYLLSNDGAPSSCKLLLVGWAQLVWVFGIAAIGAGYIFDQYISLGASLNIIIASITLLVGVVLILLLGKSILDKCNRSLSFSSLLQVSVLTASTLLLVTVSRALSLTTLPVTIGYLLAAIYAIPFLMFLWIVQALKCKEVSCCELLQGIPAAFAVAYGLSRVFLLLDIARGDFGIYSILAVGVTFLLAGFALYRLLVSKCPVRDCSPCPYIIISLVSWFASAALRPFATSEVLIYLVLAIIAIGYLTVIASGLPSAIAVASVVSLALLRLLSSATLELVVFTIVGVIYLLSVVFLNRCNVDCLGALVGGAGIYTIAIPLVTIIELFVEGTPDTITYIAVAVLLVGLVLAWKLTYCILNPAQRGLTLVFYIFIVTGLVNAVLLIDLSILLISLIPIAAYLLLAFILAQLQRMLVCECPRWGAIVALAAGFTLNSAGALLSLLATTGYDVATGSPSLLTAVLVFTIFCALLTIGFVLAPVYIFSKCIKYNCDCIKDVLYAVLFSLSGYFFVRSATVLTNRVLGELEDFQDLYIYPLLWNGLVFLLAVFVQNKSDKCCDPLTAIPMGVVAAFYQGASFVLSVAITPSTSVLLLNLAYGIAVLAVLAVVFVAEKVTCVECHWAQQVVAFAAIIFLGDSSIGISTSNIFYILARTSTQNTTALAIAIGSILAAVLFALIVALNNSKCFDIQSIASSYATVAVGFFGLAVGAALRNTLDFDLPVNPLYFIIIIFLVLIIVAVLKIGNYCCPKLWVREDVEVIGGGRGVYQSDKADKKPAKY